DQPTIVERSGPPRRGFRLRGDERIDHVDARFRRSPGDRHELLASATGPADHARGWTPMKRKPHGAGRGAGRGLPLLPCDDGDVVARALERNGSRKADDTRANDRHAGHHSTPFEPTAAFERTPADCHKPHATVTRAAANAPAPSAS